MMKVDTMTDKLLSFKEAAQYLKISSPTLYRMIRNCDIVAYKVKGNWKFRKKDIEEYLKSHANKIIYNKGDTK